MPPKRTDARNRGLRLTLTGDNNHTLEGTIHLQDPNLLKHLVHGLEPSKDAHVTTVAPRDDYDPKGASAYAIVVIFVYGFSIVLLIASHIFLKKKEDKKDGENEKEINKYLEQAPTLQRNSEKESFRKLKKSIIPLVSVGMLAGGRVNIPESAKISIPSSKDRRESQRTRHSSHGSQRSQEEDDQIAPLLSASPFSAKRVFEYDEDPEPPEMQSGPMPTIFEGAENESIKSLDIAEQQSKTNCSLIIETPWNSSDKAQRADRPLALTPKANQYKPPIVRILESRRQVYGLPANTTQVRQSLPSGGHQYSQHNIVQCPRNLLKCDDEKPLQVTVL